MAKIPEQAALPHMQDMIAPRSRSCVRGDKPPPARPLPAAQLVPITTLAPPRIPVRTTVDAGQVSILAASIAEVGMLHPIIVRPRGDGPSYEVVAGLYRYFAASEAKLERVPVLVREATDQQVVLASLHENLLRNALSLTDEAAGFAWLRASGLSGNQLAARLHVAPSHISRVLRAVQDAALLAGLTAGTLTKSDALELVDCPPDRREVLVRDIAARRQAGDPLSRQELRDTVAQNKGVARRKPRPQPRAAQRQVRTVRRAVETLLACFAEGIPDGTVVTELRILHQTLSRILAGFEGRALPSLDTPPVTDSIGDV